MWEFIIRLFGDSPNSLLVLAGAAAAIAATWVSGRLTASKSIQNGHGAGAPVAIKSALDQNTEAKQRETEAIERMTERMEVLISALSASTRNAEAALNTAKELVAETRGNGEKLDRVREELIRLAKR